MPESEIRLWPGVPDLHALGARDFDDLIGVSGQLEGEERGELIHEEPGRTVLRYPLPGTVTRAGERPTRPRGAGTGFVYLTRWTRGPLGERATARLTPPRSQSFASRAWNLICHLREHGVGTAQPLVMGEENSALFAKRSFLATRELELMLPIPAYLEQYRDPTSQRRLAHALGLLFARLFEAGVDLPHLRLDSVFVSHDGGEGACAAQKIQEVLQPSATCNSPVPGLETNPLPELALATVHGGRIRDSLSEAEVLGVLRRMAEQVDSAWQLCPRELMRVAHYALLRRLPKARRRSLQAQLQRALSPR